jgi:hypothetical protein
MGPDVEQNDLPFGNLEQQRQPIAVGDAHRLHPFQLADEGMRLQLGLKRMSTEIVSSEERGEDRDAYGKTCERVARSAGSQRARNSRFFGVQRTHQRVGIGVAMRSTGFQVSQGGA